MAGRRALHEARRGRARDVLIRVRAGLPALEAPAAKPTTFEHVAEQWLARHVRAKGMRSQDEVGRLLRLALSQLAGQGFRQHPRSDVVALLDQVEDERGAKQADYVLSAVRGIMNWFATRHDDYMPRLVRGMRQTDPRAESAGPHPRRRRAAGCVEGSNGQRHIRSHGPGWRS